MDHDSMLNFTSAHFSPMEPVRFHGGSGFTSSAEEELSSDSSEDNPPRPHTLASSSGRLPIEDDDDSYSTRFPATEDFSANSSYGGAPPGPNLVHPPVRGPRLAATNTASEDNSTRSRMMMPLPGAVRYRECMKNHAASLGGHALDGCGEFLPSGADGFDALVCSACNCHRNFHRREVEGEHVCSCKRYANMSTNANVRGVSGPPTPGLFTMSTSRDIVLHPQVELPMSPLHYADEADVRSKSSSRKRRHRTKFSAEQKERMFSFAENLEWRISKQNDVSVQQFCDEVGVKRSVFKVWMHNNKHSGAKRINVGEPPIARNDESPSDY
eukprot:c6600_g1_i1 orf=769-1749(+)